ncbi:hypothetical protein CHS0354_030984 [Potamilus streckersoni]|uniref:Uncharacterized protein n=1 Tax=Potamilus streckersoni TaxID=2493646 RepID=A0AAE0VUR3_9BIVA|nr:hypothetical protein CHS0354_030984 [Potamilus streckersoni]
MFSEKGRHKRDLNSPDLRQAINLTMLVDSDSHGAKSSEKAMEYPEGMRDKNEVEKVRVAKDKL